MGNFVHPKNSFKIKKKFLEILKFFGDREGVGVILFILGAVSKHKIQLLPAKYALFCTYLKKG